MVLLDMVCQPDPINKNPSDVSIFLPAPAGSVMGIAKWPGISYLNLNKKKLLIEGISWYIYLISWYIITYRGYTMVAIIYKLPINYLSMVNQMATTL